MDVMSLTGFLADKKTLETLNANFINPVKRSGAKLIVEPAKGKGVDFGAVGTAYDYWLRCAVDKNNPDIYKSFIGYRVCTSRYGDDPRIANQLKRYIQVISASTKEGASLNVSLFEACLFIAKFEIEYRSGYPVEVFDVKPQNIEELSRIANSTKLELFLNKTIVLNPLFSVQGSKLAIQADGDIVVDGVLVDLKTSSKLKLKDNLRQLIGYWVLNLLRGSEIDIQRFGVYYPRFSYYVDFSPSDLMTLNEQNNIISYFKKRLGENIKAL